MPITLNHSNINVQYSSDKSYIIETVKSDLYRRNENVDTVIRNNIQAAPVTPTTYVDSSGNVYAVESYTYSGTANTADYTRVFTKNTTCDILIVGGGGAGGTYIGGGGGAGGVLHITNATIPVGTYNIQVGKGGTGVIGGASGTVAQNGSSSKAFGIEVFGGGYGGVGSWGTSGVTQNGANGGSGGGGGSASSGTAGTGGTVIQPSFTSSVITVNNYTYYGGNGASGITFNNNSFGSDGANGGGGAGGNAPSNTDQYNAGAGADGIAINITGTSYFWGGGGGGGQYGGTYNGKAGNGGKGGGGGGSGSQVADKVGLGGIGGITLGQDGDLEGDGTPTAGNGGSGTGGGGGGCGRTTVSPNAVSGSGGSGIVIIRYLLDTIPTTNFLTNEPTINPSILAADVYFPRVPATNASSWADNGYTVRVKVSDAVLGTGYVYFLFNHIITSQDHYHSLQSYTGTGNIYAGSTIFKTFAGIAISVDYGRSIYPKRMRIAPRPLQSGFSGNDFINGAPKAFKIFASDDAACWNDNNHSSWTQIHDQTTALTYTNEQYTIVNLTANLPKYRYYTMVVLSTIGNYAGGYMMFSEWNMGGDEKIVFELDGTTHKKLVFDYPKQGLISEITGMTNWVKIKHKPASWSTIYSGNTFNGSSISGTFTIGNSSDNSKEWAIAFNEPEVKYYLFVMHMSQLDPNYKDLWMVFEPSEMKRASDYSNTYGYHVNYPHAYKTTMKPLGFAAKNSTYYQGPGYDQVHIYNRVDGGSIGGGDPYISMYNINNNGSWTTIDVTLYAEHNTGFLFPLVEGGVYVKYDNDISFVYPPNVSYTLNFPVPTLTDINNHSNIILQGTYNINVNNSNILINPKPASFINNITNYNIERMYPPVRNFTAATTTVSGQLYGNGTYVVSYSSFLSPYEPFKCFNTSDTTGGHWMANYSNGNYNGSASIVDGYLGDWLKIQLPIAIKLTRFSFLQRTSNVSRAPKDFKIYGSNDNITWVELVNKTDAVYNASYIYEQTTPEITTAYTYYGLVVNKLLAGQYNDTLNFDEWYIYGQEVLPSSLSLRYSLLNPTLDPIGAQWTYNTSNTNVYHLGSVGIGTTSPEYLLDVRGNIFTSAGGYTQTGSENWIVQSDRRIKENIVKASYEKCLDNVKKIELYNFNFKDNCVNTNDKNQLGFIAQEVQQVYPKAVEVGRMILDNNREINDLLTLNTTQIKYTLYGAVKKLIEKIENIESRVEHIYNITLSSNISTSSSNISITFSTPADPLIP